MRPSHRLDLVLVPTAIDAPIARGWALRDWLRERGVIDDLAAPGPAAAEWASSFRSVRIEDPGRVVTWSNRLGGFHPRCPTSGAPIVGSFSAALTAWRAAAGPPSDVRLRCPACGATHALTEVDVVPPLAFAPWALVTADIGEPELTAVALGWVAAHVGETTAVLRRG